MNNIYIMYTNESRTQIAFACDLGELESVNHAMAGPILNFKSGKAIPFPNLSNKAIESLVMAWQRYFAGTEAITDLGVQ